MRKKRKNPLKKWVILWLIAGITWYPIHSAFTIAYPTRAVQVSGIITLVGYRIYSDVKSLLFGVYETFAPEPVQSTLSEAKSRLEAIYGRYKVGYLIKAAKEPIYQSSVPYHHKLMSPVHQIQRGIS